MPPPITRDRRFNMLLSEEEDSMLRTVSEAEGLTASDYLRMLIRREHSARKQKKSKR